MASSGAPTELLLQRPWLPVNIDGCQLLAKSWFGDTAYHILLTDMQSVWEERMDSGSIQSRAQELNRRLRAPVKAFFSHLREVVQPCLSGSDGRPDGPTDSEAQISLTRQEDGNISMKLKSELAGLPLYWEFHCTPAPVTVVCVQLVRPLLAMSQLLQRQVEQLGGLLGRKDAEIQDYRENGATLSRERLQTDVFEEETYRENFLSKALPLLCSEQSGTLSFDADLRHLYAAVTAHGKTRKRKLSEEEEEEDKKEEEKGQPPAGITLSSDGSVASSEAGRSRQEDAAGAKMAERPAVAQIRQSVPIPSDPAERPPSKPKKKKVGLFR
ncbi:non-homologous end-joining factor 1 [Centropristis striata]|uniref:non-homologous end-joining factor 1 n=1 Tax=Centropristis striata TaxID=184440 RepID=UPI0027DFDB9A|nr:non-homologous end-joining factor 1 [Centropristis striata]XP_059183766.1 non-homologous end-joining factor 1 [Centropristis striata]XP_059183767.1 non-homologous end-joining factor 1 [Centropristis striata]